MCVCAVPCQRVGYYLLGDCLDTLGGLEGAKARATTATTTTIIVTIMTPHPSPLTPRPSLHAPSSPCLLSRGYRPP